MCLLIVLLYYYINGVLKYFDPPHPQTMFNAYENLSMAAMEHLKFLSRTRYMLALQAAKNGNVGEYCVELKKAGYYTDKLEHYSKVMNSIYQEVLTKYGEEIVGDPYA